MFNNNMAKNNLSDSQSVNIIGAGTLIEGDITTNGDMRIDGSLTGSINVKGKLVIGVSGSVEGEIICQNADISGTIKGDCSQVVHVEWIQIVVDECGMLFFLNRPTV